MGHHLSCKYPATMRRKGDICMTVPRYVQHQCSLLGVHISTKPERSAGRIIGRRHLLRLYCNYGERKRIPRRHLAMYGTGIRCLACSSQPGWSITLPQRRPHRFLLGPRFCLEKTQPRRLPYLGGWKKSCTTKTTFA